MSIDLFTLGGAWVKWGGRKCLFVRWCVRFNKIKETFYDVLFFAFFLR